MGDDPGHRLSGDGLYLDLARCAPQEEKGLPLINMTANSLKHTRTDSMAWLS
jgi:hypothetical protein